MTVNAHRTYAAPLSERTLFAWQGMVMQLSASKYMAITGASPATATRDLVDLVETGALNREGEHRHARYHPATQVKEPQRIVIDPRGGVVTGGSGGG